MTMTMFLTLGASSSGELFVVIGDELTLTGHGMRLGISPITAHVKSHSTATTSQTDGVASAMQENAVLLPKLGKIRQFHLESPSRNFLTLNWKIHLSTGHAKKMLDNIETMRSSPDSVVRALMAVVREQSHFVAGLATVALCVPLERKKREVRTLNRFIGVTRHIFNQFGFGWFWLMMIGHDDVDDLLQPAPELMRNPTIWWTNLEKDDTERTKTFNVLSQAKMDWVVFARITLGRDLGDVRAYKLNPERAKLLPPKKKGVVETTQTAPSLSRK